MGVLGLVAQPAVLAAWTTRQLWFDGLINGMVFGLLALGIVLVYRSTKVINLAVGNMGLPASGLLGLLVINYKWPFWIALIAAMLVGTLVGAVALTILPERIWGTYVGGRDPGAGAGGC